MIESTILSKLNKKNLISLLYHSSKPRLNKLWENLMNISKILIYKIFLEEEKKNH